MILAEMRMFFMAFFMFASLDVCVCVCVFRTRTRHTPRAAVLFAIGFYDRETEGMCL